MAATLRTCIMYNICSGLYYTHEFTIAAKDPTKLEDEDPAAIAKITDMDTSLSTSIAQVSRYVSIAILLFSSNYACIQ